MASDGDTSKYGDGVFTGYVKWFNRTQGWGFVTITGEEFAGDDIFVHWNSLKVEEEQYRYLLNDEPVQFTISWNKDAKHPYQATDVTGVSGKLMCERRNEKFKSRPARETTGHDGETGHKRVARGGRGPRSTGGRTGQRSSRPTYNDENGNKWVMVQSRRGRGPRSTGGRSTTTDSQTTAH